MYLSISLSLSLSLCISTYIYIYIHMHIHIYIYIPLFRGVERIATHCSHTVCTSTCSPLRHMPNLPTKIIPTKIYWLRLSGKFHAGLGIPPINIQILLE